MTDNLEHEEQHNDLVYALTCTTDFALCFAARGTGLYRSEDGGTEWNYAYTSLNFSEPMPTTSLVISPDISVEPVVIAGMPGGILRSTDAGLNWEAGVLASPPPMVSTLAISPNYIADGVVFIGTSEDGVFRSANRGRQWSRWNFGLLDLSVFCMAVSPNYARDETLYVGVESGIFRSTNGGRAWREVDLPIGFDPVLSLAISPYFAEDGVIYAGTETKGLLRSTDRGQNWEIIGTHAISASVNSVLLSPHDPHTPDILLLHETDLLLSRDNGETWDKLQTTADNITAICAPQGMQAGSKVLLGLMDGTVQKMEL